MRLYRCNDVDKVSTAIALISDVAEDRLAAFVEHYRNGNVGAALFPNSTVILIVAEGPCAAVDRGCRTLGRNVNVLRFRGLSCVRR